MRKPIKENLRRFKHLNIMLKEAISYQLNEPFSPTMGKSFKKESGKMEDLLSDQFSWDFSLG
jgi:hypothetical protein